MVQCAADSYNLYERLEGYKKPSNCGAAYDFLHIE